MAFAWLKRLFGADGYGTVDPPPHQEPPLMALHAAPRMRTKRVHKPAPHMPKPGREFYVRVAGVSFPNDDGSSRQAAIKRCRIGETATLIPDSGNRFDPLAIRVLSASGAQIGFLPKESAEHRGLNREVAAGLVTATIVGTNTPARDVPFHGVVLHIVIAPS